MSSATQTAATLDDLYRVKGKAELISGRIIPLMPTGRRPSRVAFTYLFEASTTTQQRLARARPSATIRVSP